MTPEELQNKVRQHDRDLSNQLTEIVELQRKVDTLTSLMQNFFTYTSSTQRFTDQQEAAFHKIPELLRELLRENDSDW
jgi:hypothetical protein